MSQPFADALTWVPKSRALGASLGRAHDLARAQGHAAVTLEHALAALIEDPDASALLLSCTVDLLSLNAAIGEHLHNLPAAGVEMPEAAPALLTILEYAVAAARQSKRPEINGAIVLAAMIGEGKSEAARLLLAGGMKFEDAVLALRRTTAPRAAAPPEPVAASPLPGPPPMPVVAPAVEPAAPAPAEPDRPSPASQTLFDDDPVTTARRRIAAIRSGQPPPAYEPPTPAPRPSATAIPADNHQARDGTLQVAAPASAAVPAALLEEATALAVNARTADWAPPPLPHPVAPANRPVRMPPPVPPIGEPPVRSKASAIETASGTRAHVPWAEPTSQPLPELEPRPAPAGSPIKPEELIEQVPSRMQAGVSVTVEIRIPRSAAVSTALGPGATRDGAITRALSVRLRAPSGGFHVENASPETQWFDAKGVQRAEDEVRWRWLVTPHGPAKLPLQLSIALRTIAQDGMIIETALPEQQARVHIVRNLGRNIRAGLVLVIAISTGVALTLLASGGLASLLGM